MIDKDKLEKLKKLADAMYYAAQHITTDASRLHKAMDEYHQFIIHECKEEPVSNPIDFEKELYKAFGQVKDFTLGMRIAKWFYSMGKNSQEFVSEDLEKELSRLLKDCEIDSEYIHQDFLHIVANHFADWQKEQFEKNRLKHCNSITNEQAELEQGFIDQHLDKYQRMPTFLDAIEYGMNLQKEQMMAKAVDVTIAIPYPNGYGGYTQLLDSKEGLPFGDKLKVLVIKEADDGSNK